MIKQILITAALGLTLAAPALAGPGFGAVSYDGQTTGALYYDISAGPLNWFLSYIPTIEVGVRGPVSTASDKFGTALFVRDLQPVYTLGPAELDVSLGLLSQNHTPLFQGISAGAGSRQEAPLLGAAVSVGPVRALLERDTRNGVNQVSVGVTF
ncbi:MAG: hypothetical protein KGI47_06655 [Betaproteobacteria bacterium]|nr:hypothetical protein [Betaproteobacteria bacterium]MDE2623331.1 hypothetical protein [Betaproteobacteria bacterium]